MIEKTVYILVPNKHRLGGVFNYYSHIKKYLGRDYKYLYRGEKCKKEPKKVVPFRLLTDYVAFVDTLQKGGSTVLINTSLGKGGFFRDGIYTLLTPRNYKKIVFFRGWNPTFEKKIGTSSLLKKWLKSTFLKADHIIVLSSAFKNRLIEWGYSGPITVETTLVDETLMQGETWNSISEKRADLSQTSLLYLGNVSKGKGVWEVVDSLKRLSFDGDSQRALLNVAGSGSDLGSLQKYTEENSLNVKFLGYVKELKKVEAFKNAHLYLFASYHEGMPNSVLEAMAFGLPVITTRVGGIPDFFEDGKMGLFLDNRNPLHIAQKIQYLLDRPDLMQQISKYNFEYAKKHFYAVKVARRFKDIVESVAKKRNA